LGNPCREPAHDTAIATIRCDNPAQRIMNLLLAFHQRLRRRLLDEVKCTQLQGLNGTLTALFGDAAQHDGVYRKGIRFDQGQELDAIHHWHLDVHENQSIGTILAIALFAAFMLIFEQI